MTHGVVPLRFCRFQEKAKVYRSILVCLLMGLASWCFAVNNSFVNISHIHHDVVLAPDSYEIKSTFRLAERNLPGKHRIPLVTSRTYEDLESLIVYYNGQQVHVSEPQSKKQKAILPVLGGNVTLLWLTIDREIEKNSLLTVQYKMRRTPSEMELINHNDFLMVGKVVQTNCDSYDICYEVITRPISDYSDPVMHSANLHHPEGFGVVASARPDSTVDGHKVADISAAQFLVGFYKKADWNSRDIVVAGTPFTIMSRKQGSYINLGALTKAVKLVWPQYVERFYSIPRHIFFIGLEGPLGGGSVGNNVLAIYDSKKISAELQSYLHHNSGFRYTSENTKGYMEEIYPESSQPVWNYTLDLVAHELGHLYFGFGETYENARARHDPWLSLGLGLIYDQEFYRNIAGKQPQLVGFSTRRWREHFSKIKDIDQRLENPDTSNDEKYHLDRLQSFSHGKSSVVLGELRNRLGAKKFDQLVLRYIKGELGGFGYANFRSGLKEVYSDISEFEVEWGIR